MVVTLNKLCFLIYSQAKIGGIYLKCTVWLPRNIVPSYAYFLAPLSSISTERAAMQVGCSH